jgi:transcriptional regulator with XRE-family HTH domain
MAAEKDPAFAGRLRELRAAAKLTQFDLAVKAGVKPSTIARLEQGAAQPEWNTVRALAAALGVGVEVFAEPPSTSIPPRTLGRPKKSPKRKRSDQ